MNCNITISEIKRKSDLPERSDCEENGCELLLDDIPHRAALEPDAVNSGETRADCCIFFPEELEESNTLYRDEQTEEEDPEPEYAGIIELKNTVSDPGSIKQQLKGALDCAVDILQECDDPPWNISFFALVAHNGVRTPHKSIRDKRVATRVDGNAIPLNPVPVRSGSILREVIEEEDVQKAIYTL